MRPAAPVGACACQEGVAAPAGAGQHEDGSASRDEPLSRRSATARTRVTIYVGKGLKAHLVQILRSGRGDRTGSSRAGQPSGQVDEVHPAVAAGVIRGLLPVRPLATDDQRRCRGRAGGQFPVLLRRGLGVTTAASAMKWPVRCDPSAPSRHRARSGRGQLAGIGAVSGGLSFSRWGGLAGHRGPGMR